MNIILFRFPVPPAEESGQLCDHGCVLLALVSSNVRSGEGIVDILPHAVQERGDLLLLCFD